MTSAVGTDSSTPSFTGDCLVIAKDMVSMGSTPSEANAVAIRRGRIAQVGQVEELSAVHADLPVIDCGDSTLVPGFVDGHCHFEMATTVEANWVHVHTPPYTSLEEIAARISEEVEARPASEWLLCRSSFSMHEKVKEGRLFTRQELDRVCPDRPVAVFASLHVCSMNTLALKALHLWDPSAIHPEHGVVHREVDGTPTGVVTEAFLLIPVETDSEAFKQLVVEHASRRWNAAGTTTVHTMPESLDQAMWELELHRARRLPLRQRHYFISPALGGVEEIAQLRKHYDQDGDMVRFGGIKLFANGCAHDGLGHELDDAKFTQEELDAVVLAAHRLGIQVWIHSLNSPGIAAAARAIARAQSIAPGPHRHRIEHGGDYVDLSDLELVKRSGALLVTTPQFMYSTAADLAPTHAPWRSILDHDIPLVAGTDSTGTVPDSISVLRNLEVATSRRGSAGRPVGLEQALTPREALSAFTTWSSYGGFEEQDKGRIVPGLLGDLTALSGNPLDPHTSLADIHVRETILGGEIVFSA